jgi:hypothetical protein
MLASFPSGLVIYWAWNNVLSLLQQYAIMRKNDAEIHLWRNLGIEKWKGRVEAVKAFGTQRLGRATDVGSGKPKPANPPQRGPHAKPRAANLLPQAPMTREQALRTLGLDTDATAAEIELALAKATGMQAGLNGSDHAIAAKIDEARHILSGKEGR